MILSLAALLIVMAGGIAATGAGGRIHPLVFLLAAGVVFGTAAELSLPYTLRSMDDGFSAAIGSLGPLLIAGSVAGIAIERSHCGDWLGEKLARSRGWMAAFGFIGGFGAAREFAFILLMPLATAVARRRTRPMADPGLPLALAVIVSSALVVPAPGPVAAAAILSADLWQTALWGLAVAASAGLAGCIFSFLANGWQRNADGKLAAVEEPPAAAPIRPPAALAGALSVFLPLLLLVISSVGHMPGEPLGGGPIRERLLSLGQPMILLLTALAASAAAAACLRPKIALLSENWTAQALMPVASIAMLVGAAGAFSRVLQNSGLDSIAAEALTDAPLGILLPFAVAAAMKLAQGSSLIAIISTAGLLQPSLPQLGLDDETGRALCAVAVGAGSMVASHVNDTLFWTFTRLCNLTPAQGLRLLTLGTLVQGVAAAVTLLVISAVVR